MLEKDLKSRKSERTHQLIREEVQPAYWVARYRVLLADMRGGAVL